MKLVYGILSLCVMLVLALGASCAPSQARFGIYLAETDELIVSEAHVAAYDAAEHAFELNADGIKRWNSYHAYTDIPKMQQSLYQQDFVIKADGEVVCRGRFYSMLSSASYEGLAIIDAVMPLDAEHAKVWLISDYPGAALGDEYTDVAAALADIFAELGRLRVA